MSADLVSAVDDGVCHPACLFGNDAVEGRCSCRCGGEFHGAARRETDTAHEGGLPDDPPVGWWFHTWEPLSDEKLAEKSLMAITATKVMNGALCERAWQGQIVGRLGGSRFFVQLFSWWDGAPTEIVIVDADRLLWATLYRNNDAMRAAGGCNEIVDGRRCGRQIVGYKEVHHFDREYACSRCLEYYSGKLVLL